MSLISEKQLKILLFQVNGFKAPQISLEQYITPPEIAANILTFIDREYNDLSGKKILDLGCGTGILSIGSCVFGSNTTGVDICMNALTVAKENALKLGINNIDFVCSDVSIIKPYFLSRKFDTVVMNPPFGTKLNTGIDIQFLTTAITLSNSVIYSLHKRTTRKHILKYAQSNQLQTEVIAEIKFNIEKTFISHKKVSVDIEVDLIKFEISH